MPRVYRKSGDPEWEAMVSLKFVPYPPDLAKWLAAEIERRAPKRPECDLCEHPMRETLNRMLLQGVLLSMVIKEAKTWAQTDWTEEVVIQHRDEHLLWQIKNEILPRPDEVMLRPPPLDIEGQEGAQWFWWRLWAIGQTSYERGQYAIALKAHDAMRLHMFDGVWKKRVQAAITSNQQQIGNQQGSLPEPDEREKELLERFRNAAYRKNDDEENIG